MTATVILRMRRPTQDITITNTPTGSLRHSAQRRSAALIYWTVY